MNEELLERIEDEYYSLSPTNRLIADQILKNEKLPFKLTVSQLASKSFCAPSTIIKFIKIFNYESFVVFKHDLNIIDNLYIDTIQKSFLLVEKSIEMNLDIYNKLVDKILNFKSIYIFASGQSQIAALDFFLKSNKNVKYKFIFSHDTGEQKKYSKNIVKDDVVLLISNSGECREIKLLTKNFNDNTFLITNRGNSSISKKVKYTIDINNHFENSNNFKEFSRESKYSLLYLLDLLYESIFNSNKKP